MKVKELPLSVVIVGAGRRGIDVFGKFALENPSLLKFIAIVEPNQQNREFFSQEHNLSMEQQFEDLEQFFNNQKASQVSIAINATNDQSHYYTTKKLLEKGFHVLLEKPIAITLNECQELEKIAQEKQRILMICHVLRYAELFSKIKELIEEGTIGKIKTINLIEDIGTVHFAHSYVRGNWNNSTTSGPISLTKTCHDFDLIVWFLDYAKCQHLFSYSPELFFQEKNAFGKVPDYCLEGCSFDQTCPYYAPSYYLNKSTKQSRKRAVAISLKEEDLLKNLQSGPYGRCVFKCNNNVPNTQITTMTFTDGICANLIMVTDQLKSNRQIKIFGEKGTISGNLIAGKIIVNLKGRDLQEINLLTKNDHHGGGDYELIKAFITTVRNSSLQKSRTDITNSIFSHKLAFQAEESRINFKNT